MCWHGLKFNFLTFISRVMVIFVLKSPQFSMNFHDNSIKKNWKIDFLFDSEKSNWLATVYIYMTHSKQIKILSNHQNLHYQPPPHPPNTYTRIAHRIKYPLRRTSEHIAVISFMKVGSKLKKCEHFWKKKCLFKNIRTFKKNIQILLNISELYSRNRLVSTAFQKNQPSFSVLHA